MGRVSGCSGRKCGIAPLKYLNVSESYGLHHVCAWTHSLSPPRPSTLSDSTLLEIALYEQRRRPPMDGPPVVRLPSPQRYSRIFFRTSRLCVGSGRFKLDGRFGLPSFETYCVYPCGTRVALEWHYPLYIVLCAFVCGVDLILLLAVDCSRFRATEWEM